MTESRNQPLHAPSSRTTVAVLVVCLLGMVSCNGKTPGNGKSTVAPTRVVVDADTRYQTVSGFGTSERVFDDPHVTNTFDPHLGRAAVVPSPAEQSEILDKLYGELRLTRVRPVAPEVSHTSGIEPQNDNDDPNLFDWSRFDFDWKNLDDHCRYVLEARERGLTTFFLSPLFRELWMDTRTSRDAAEYAEWLLAMVLRCRDLGAESPYLSIVNEPSFERNPMSPEFIRQVVLALGPRLRAEGLETMLVIPDDVTPSKAAAVARVVLADGAARQYVGALATHLYDEPLSSLTAMKAVSEEYGLPLWMTEFSLSLGASTGLGQHPFAWANLVHELLATYGVSAIDYQWGFFGQWAPHSQFIVLQHRGHVYQGFQPTKEYFLTGQYSRYVPEGARRVLATSTNGDVKVTAFRTGDDLVLVCLNNGSVGHSAEVEVRDLPDLRQVASVRTTADEENWVAQPSTRVDDGRFAVTLPAQSVTTFTTER